MGKSIIVAAVAVAVVAGCAGSSDPGAGEATSAGESALGANDLSKGQAKLILDSLNDHCGDSWCEGDLDIDFQKISCSFAAKTCTISAKLTDPGRHDGPEDDRVFVRSCKMQDLTAFESIVETSASGFQDLTDAFYDKADACVTKMESSIPH